jgi:hypothetical protein
MFVRPCGAIGQLGRSVTDTLTKMKDCGSNVGEMQPHRTLGGNAADVCRDSSG